ncbi:MAG: bifunctional hydroxymethylpyrimidine kinase/phosphomethylpyrimidine kinase [Alphaproteobacteria bacterium]|nr:bifunctional hydroxymethylpyrimidine kinase/phosphomethylpyrimidine kinase [Alphaproteobacteria bacterium]
MPNGVILTIDTTDPCGGSGINAAIKAAAALGGYAQAAVTGVTVQTPEQTLGIFPVSPAVVSDQIRAAFTSFPVSAILIGLLPTRDIVEAVADALENLNPRPPIVLDPVISSRDGKRFLEKDAIDAMKRRLFLLADLLLPNVQEAEALSGLTITDEASLEHAAEMLVTLGPRNVFIKGDSLNTEQIFEIYTDDRRTQVFNRERITSKRTHGAGATLAAAVTTLIALGNTPRDSVTRARFYVEEAIKNAPDFGTDCGPLNHFVK